MAAPKRTDPDEFFELLDEHQLAHLQELRSISLSYAPEVTEVLHWNQPAYLRESERMWMLQAFKGHCSLRFSPEWFQAHRDEVIVAGYDAGEGFLKIPYDKPVPVELCRSLIEAKLADTADA